MAGIDNAGIAIAVAIVVIFLGIASVMSAAQDAGPVVSKIPAVVTAPAETEESDSSGYGGNPQRERP